MKYHLFDVIVDSGTWSLSAIQPKQIRRSLVSKSSLVTFMQIRLPLICSSDTALQLHLIQPSAVPLFTVVIPRVPFHPATSDLSQPLACCAPSKHARILFLHRCLNVVASLRPPGAMALSHTVTLFWSRASLLQPCTDYQSDRWGSG